MRFWSGRARLAAEWWLTAVLASALVLFLVLDKAAARLDEAVYDRLVRAADRTPDPAILLVAFDNQALQEIGPWPWPRDVHARLIDRLGAARPRAILYDVLFLEPTPADPLVGAAMRRAGGVFVPLLLDAPGPDGAAFAAVEPVSPVRAAAAGVGHVNLPADPDGVMRHMRLAEHDGDLRWPHLVTLAARHVGGAQLPIEERRPSLIPFAGPPGTFPTITAGAVLRGEVPPELLRGRLVIVGATAQGLGDNHSVPVGDQGGVMSGIELQANMLDGLLQRAVVTQATVPVHLASALLPLWILLVSFRRLRPRSTMLVLGMLFLLVLTATVAALLSLGLWLPPAAGLIGLLLVFPLWGWRRLAAVSVYMVGELERLRGEPGLGRSLGAEPATLDRTARETKLLGDAISELRAARRFVGESLDQMPDAVFVVGPNGEITLSNHHGRDLIVSLGLAPEANLPTLLASFAPEAPLSARPLWPPTGDGERREARSHDQRIFDLLYTVHSGTDAVGLGWIVRLTDISAVRAAQRQRDELLRFLTHDLRSPQISIMALADRDNAARIAPDLAERIGRYARRTLDLADGIVHLARAENLVFDPEPLNLADLAVEALDELWPQTRARGMTVSTHGLDSEALVSGERGLLARALINLVDNAVKYGREGGRIECRVKREGGRTICEVSNDGPGIPPERVAALFTPFIRAAPDAGTHGSGLGLAFVATVAARHGGSIVCRNEPDGWITFTFALPATEWPTDA